MFQVTMCDLHKKYKDTFNKLVTFDESCVYQFGSKIKRK